MKRIYEIAAFIGFAALFVFASCDKYGGDPIIPGTDLLNIKIGPVTEIHSGNIGVGGGTIRIAKPGTPVDGVEMVIPSGSFVSDQTIKVSYADIISHQLGQYFNPISPMITILCEGGYANEILSLTIPVTIPAGHIPLGFYFDETTGKLEGIPFKEIGKGSITLLTRHFLSADKLKSRARPLKSSTLMGLGANIIISSISESVLSGQPIISSGFKPGVDDWEFANYGSYLAPGGHCAGQNMAAMWYYFEKKAAEGNLFNKFSDNPALWEDNARGYRFCSVIHKDLDWNGRVVNMFDQYIDKNQELDKLKLFTIAGTMLVTGEPQGIGVYRQSGLGTNGTPIYGGHDLICYQLSVPEGKLFISDPNYPGTGQVIEFKGDKFQPYVGKLNANDVSNPYPYVTYYAKTAYIEWGQIGSRYGELLANTIGTVAPNVFPDYTIYGLDDTGGFELKDGQVVIKDTLRTVVICPTAERFTEVDNQKRIGHAVFDQNGGIVSQMEEDQKAMVILKPGLNTLGYYIAGWRNNSPQTLYIDFKWITVKYFPLSIDPDPLKGEPGKEYQLTAQTKGAAPSNSTYTWDFGDGTQKVIRLNDNKVLHTYTNEGDFIVSVDVTDAAKVSLGKAYSLAKIYPCGEGAGTFVYDGRTYKYKTYGTQTWMTENLAYLPQVSPSSSISNYAPRYYVTGYNGTSVIEAKATPNYATYGVLYNWEAAKIACPPGWHLPHDSEWQTLEMFLGLTQAEAAATGYRGDIARKMKSTWGWYSTGNGNNSSCFNILPAGGCDDHGGFYGLTNFALFWTPDLKDQEQVWTRNFSWEYDGINRTWSWEWFHGQSVRCLRND